MDSIFESIKDAFSALWTFRKRGDSYEIITPFATIAGMYVSVFLTHRESGYVVTDGGWLDKGVYGALPHCAAKTADLMFVRLGNPCGVERTTSPDGLEYFYKNHGRPKLDSKCHYGCRQFRFCIDGIFRYLYI